MYKLVVYDFVYVLNEILRLLLNQFQKQQLLYSFGGMIKQSERIERTKDDNDKHELLEIPWQKIMNQHQCNKEK